MNRFKHTHLSLPVLEQHLRAVAARSSDITAELVSYIAEFDARKGYLPAGYSSMIAYCVGELRLSEDAARKRVHAARVAREFPAVFAMLSDGRLHLSAVVMLAPHLTPESADELLAAATHRSKSQIELLLAERFPQQDLVASVVEIAATSGPCNNAPQVVANIGSERAPGRVDVPAAPGRITPIAPARYALQLTLGQATHEKLCQAQAFLSHTIPSGDLEQVLDHVLTTANAQYAKRKFAATAKPRAGRRQSRRARHIPAHVKREVWARDRGQCTFVGASGHRCEERRFLEFDHAQEVARGGEATVENVRVRCHSHNQYAAECTFGRGFMDEKRQASKARAKAKARAAAEAAARKEADAAKRAQAAAESVVRAEAQAAKRAREAAANEVIPYLRALGSRPDEARRAVALCEHMPDAPLEARVRAALAFFVPRGTRVDRPGDRIAAAPFR